MSVPLLAMPWTSDHSRMPADLQRKQADAISALRFIWVREHITARFVVFKHVATPPRSSVLL